LGIPKPTGRAEKPQVELLMGSAPGLGRKHRELARPASTPLFVRCATEPDARRSVESSTKGMTMDKDRIKGSAQQAKGAVKEVAGKVTGDAKLEAEGKADKAAGKVKNAVGGLKDALRGK
jgi:uncharacterized protein YjbJ (UPF0337 family)